MPSQPRVLCFVSVTKLLVLTGTRTPTDYEAFANALRNIDKKPAVTATIWQGEPDPFHPNPPTSDPHPAATGKWFCAGTDVKARGGSSNASTDITIRSAFASNVVSTHLDTSKAVGNTLPSEKPLAYSFRLPSIRRFLSLL